MAIMTPAIAMTIASMPRPIADTIEPWFTKGECISIPSARIRCTDHCCIECEWGILNELEMVGSVESLIYPSRVSDVT